MTEHEISRDLALAIGWTPNQMIKSGCMLPELWCDTGIRTGRWQDKWRPFSYTDPAVIWPIAERYNLFPYALRDKDGKRDGRWNVMTPDHEEYTADTAAKAVAMAVIGSKT